MEENLEEGITVHRRGDRLLMYAVFVCGVIFICLEAKYFDYTPDDAYIYFQYAKKIVQGKGFSFNGDVHSYGTTGPLWALVIAGGMKTGLSPYATAKSLDLSFALLSVLALYVLSKEIFHSTMYACLAAACLFLDAWFVRWASSGMESSMAVFLSLMGVLLAFRNYRIASAIIFGCLSLVRPEGGLLFIIFFFGSLFAASSASRLSVGRIVPILWYTVIVSAWLIFSYLHFGKILPNTFSGKAAGFPHLGEVGPSAFRILTILAATQFPLLVVFIVGLFWGRKKSIFQYKYSLLVWVVALPLFYVFDGVQVVSRYLLIIIPFLIVGGVAGIQQLEHSLKLSSKKVLMLVTAVFLWTLLQNQYLYWNNVQPHLDNFITGTNDCLKPIGRWLRNNTDEKALIFIPDVGIVAYYSDRNICDVGLITPEAGKAFYGLDYDSGMLQKKYDSVLHPDYVIDRSPVPERLASASLLPVLTRQFPGLGVSKNEPRYYTVYKAIR